MTTPGPHPDPDKSSPYPHTLIFHLSDGFKASETPCNTSYNIYLSLSFFKQGVINFSSNSQQQTALNSAHAIWSELPSTHTLSPLHATLGGNVLGDVRHTAGGHAIMSDLNKSTQSNLHSTSLNIACFRFTDSCKKFQCLTWWWTLHNPDSQCTTNSIMGFNAENAEKASPCNFKMQYMYIAHINQWNSHVVSWSFLYDTIGGQVTAKCFLFAVEAST